ncbi:Coq4p [Sugiyamaella lignohabitans]|uniref:4-hydroxy-3-methoxy-5-polyprenylbenzoate decarboxylase n=1 Tax=Sugiyamaella lignohabitans TaxID=796027 RepID=A0A161HFY7_9ASCO|nr:Coq4p [Sugiyamaella lignohabitans]ANB11571.1 Coq4p [Sugiyamaella lignohabitans]
MIDSASPDIHPNMVLKYYYAMKMESIQTMGLIRPTGRLVSRLVSMSNKSIIIPRLVRSYSSDHNFKVSAKPNYPGHVPLNMFQRAFLFVGSGIAALSNPRRPDLIATFGEMTVQPYFITRLRDEMLLDPVGRRILRERPRITSKSLDLDKLRALPPNTVGNVYMQWLDREGVSPDTRLPVRYIDDAECAYVMQRYRECHDFYHAITGLPVLMEGEVAVKAFEFANLGIPMTGLAAFSEPFKLAPKARRRIKDIYIPWAISNGLRSKLLLNVYWEEVLDKDADELRAELGIDVPPDLRQLRNQTKSKSVHK